MVDVLNEVECTGVRWGDVHLLDEPAVKCTHADLMKMSPALRHTRMFDALLKSKLFTASFTYYPGKRGAHGRVARLKTPQSA